MQDDIMVSIVCVTYNHAEFIKDALEGFVNQKTNFRYEIIVHDDVSTDGTREIVKEYESRYPELFNNIYQETNQYSKGINIETNFVYPRVRGKYTAICEGDDYWIDNNKLQKQIDFLESHSDYVACAHSTKILDYRTGEYSIYHEANADEELNLADILDWSGDRRFSTCSVVYKSEFNFRPEAFTLGVIGDYPRALYQILSGRIYFLHDIMAVYRTCTSGSWTESYEESLQNRKKHLIDMCDMLSRVDEYSGYKYHDEFEYVKSKEWYPILIKEEKYKEIWRDYKVIWKDKSLKSKIYLFVAAFMPWLLAIGGRNKDAK